MVCCCYHTGVCSEVVEEVVDRTEQMVDHTAQMAELPELVGTVAAVETEHLADQYEC